jgi:endoglucanase
MRSLTAWDVVQEMKMGWNLGNSLDSTRATYHITAEPKSWETAWSNPVTTKELISAVIEAGFNVIRIPVSWEDHIYMDDGYKIEGSWMDRVQEVVDYAYEQGVYVIINAHHESWYEPYYENEEKAADMLAAVWTQIGERFAAYDEHLIFEGMNEPRKIGTDVEWNGGDQEGWDVVNHLDQVFVDTVRGLGGNNPYRILMVPGYGANCWNGLPNLKVPEGDDKLVVSVHAYEPYDFALNTQGTGSWNQDTGNIDTIMQNIKSLFIDKGIPVIIGEFGAMVKSDEGNLEDRAAWAKYYTASAREIGVPCIWWDNGSFYGNGERFGLIDRALIKWKFPEIVDALKEGAKG